MTALIIIAIVLLILAVLFVPFARQMLMDKVELKKTPINEKFSVVVSTINEIMLDGNGEITLFEDDPRVLNLMSDDRRNLLIELMYSTGHLTIILNYKYFQNELIHKETYYNLREIDDLTQKRIATEFIKISQVKMQEHRLKVESSV